MEQDGQKLPGAICYPAGALLGPVPMALVLVFSKTEFTRRCAAQALAGSIGLALAAMGALLLLLIGLIAEVLLHGTASFTDSATAPPLVQSSSLAAGFLVLGTYALQFALGLAFAVRAAGGTVTLFPLVGAKFDRSIARSTVR